VRRQRTRAELEAELSSVYKLISDHPLGSERHNRANAIIESMEGAGQEAIEAALAEEGLPSLLELGKTQAKGILSFGRLHRRRQKLTNTLDRLAE
jgi:hypothetical protein